MHDDVHSPDHYMWHPFAQCFDITEEFPGNLAYAIKYIWRHDHKGEPIKDLEKAIDCIKREIERKKRQIERKENAEEGQGS